MSKDPLLDAGKIFARVFEAELETDNTVCQFEIWDKGLESLVVCGQIALPGRRVCAEHEDRDMTKKRK